MTGKIGPNATDQVMQDDTGDTAPKATERGHAVGGRGKAGTGAKGLRAIEGGRGGRSGGGGNLGPNGRQRRAEGQADGSQDGADADPIRIGRASSGGTAPGGQRGRGLRAAASTALKPDAQFAERVATGEAKTSASPDGSMPAFPPSSRPEAEAVPAPAFRQTVPAAQPSRAPATSARIRTRHYGVFFTFLLFVLLPAAATAYYLWTYAADQYASTVGFSVRKEEAASPLDALSGLASLGSSSSSDSEILYQFIQGQEIVGEIDKKIDLRAIWSKPVDDPVFSFHAPGQIEDLMFHWGRMVNVSFDNASGLIEVRALAFTPEDATRIATEIFDRSSEMINALSTIARDDSIRYARQDLDDAVGRLKSARQALTTFRIKNNIVDPTADVQSQASLVGQLQSRLADEIINLDLLKNNTKASDPRIVQAEQRIAVIEKRIREQRGNLGIGAGASDQTELADMLSQYESLAVDQQFAETTYTAALAGYDGALAESRRQTRYLAAHVIPTIAEKSEYPNRIVLQILISLFLATLWSIGVLVYYSLRDRR